MSQQCLIAEYANFDDAKVALAVLETDRFTPEDVSIVRRKEDLAMEEIRKLEDRHTDSPSATSSAAVGAAVGASIATPIAFGSLIGPFFIAGPMAGMAAGAVAGGLLAGTDRWGVQEEVAQSYEQRVQSGSVLVLVHHDDPIRIDDAEALLMTCEHVELKRYEAADGSSDTNKSATARDVH